MLELQCVRSDSESFEAVRTTSMHWRLAHLAVAAGAVVSLLPGRATGAIPDGFSDEAVGEQ